VFCVTGSVAVRSEQDGQDATGHDSIIGHYPPSRADFTLYRENREFDERPDQFFKTTAIDHSAIPPRRKSRQNSRNLGARDLAQESSPSLAIVSPATIGAYYVGCHVSKRLMR
jgi:hypothetical protein